MNERLPVDSGQGKYDVLLADPPWKYNSRKAGNERKYLPTKFGGGAEKHYALMSDEEILRLAPMVDSLAAENCALFLWATCPRLPLAIEVMKAWGFRYATVVFTWIKRCPCKHEKLRPIVDTDYRWCQRCGALRYERNWILPEADLTNLIYNPGYYTASNAEIVLLGVRGSMRPKQPMVQQVVEAPRGRHSAKPEEVRRRIETMYPDARKIELFARPPHPEGWDVWGLEAERRFPFSDTCQTCGEGARYVFETLEARNEYSDLWTLRHTEHFEDQPLVIEQDSLFNQGEVSI